MSLDIIDASPSVGAYRCDPMTAADIDAHPDRDRIWATIAALRANVAVDADKALDDAIEDGAEKARDAATEATQDTLDDCRARLKSALDKIDARISEADRRALLEALA